MNSSFHSHCLLCNSGIPEPMRHYEKAGLVRCPDCKFIFCSKIPTLEELIAHYKTYPRNDAISPITLKRYNTLIDTLGNYVSGRTWLDVGCGNGHLLAVAAEKNWKVLGTEFTDEAVAICRSKNISMQQGELNVSNYQPASVDVISFIEVLEHINNPHEEVEKFHELLKKKGILYITTPNFNSLSRYQLKSNWNIIEYPEHLCYYTPSTLNKLLSQHGFKKISLKTSGYNPARRGGYVAGVTEQIKVNEEKLRERTENNALFGFLKSTVNFTLNMFNSGDTIKAVYQKV